MKTNSETRWLPSQRVLLGLLALAVAIVAMRKRSVAAEAAAYEFWLVPVFVIAIFLVRLTTPGFTTSFETLQRRRWFSVALVFSSMLGLIGIILHWGNQQFGSWDYSVVIDTGWRQIIGQRPYLDFNTPNPPLFNLGSFWAFRLFGVHWNALLLFASIFACAAFVWSFWLLRRLSLSPLAAWLICVALQGFTFIAYSVWWYNGPTHILSSIFLLSILLCGSRVEYEPAAWLSYAASLGLLAVSKANLAGLAIAGGVVLLFFAAPRPRWKMVAYTALGAAISCTMLALGHVSLQGMIACYHASSIERGGFSSFGLSAFNRLSRLIILLPPIICCALLVGQWRTFLQSFRRRDLRSIALYLLLPLALFIELYGMRTDGAHKISEMASFYALVGVVLLGSLQTHFGPKAKHATRLLFVAWSLALIAFCFRLEVTRDGVRGNGIGDFYQSTDNHIPIRDSFFTNLYATPRMAIVQQEAHRAAATLPRPVFMGPRLEYLYADLQLPSPRYWPVYYQPGTSHARAQDPAIQQQWQNDHFGALIFLGDDRTFYSPEKLAVIDRDFVRVPGYSVLQVYVRRQP